jgi:hypothetical protein
MYFMKAYKNLNGNSGITYYEIGEDFIDIRFENKTDIYRYQNPISNHHLNEMKKLAVQGKGLGTYINQHPEVRYNHIIIQKA